MALKLIEDYGGFNAYYWKIIKITVDYLDSITTIEIALYFSEDTKVKQRKNILRTERYVFLGIYNKPAEAYDILKTVEIPNQDTGELEYLKFHKAEDI